MLKLLPVLLLVSVGLSAVSANPQQWFVQALRMQQPSSLLQPVNNFLPSTSQFMMQSQPQQRILAPMSGVTDQQSSISMNIPLISGQSTTQQRMINVQPIQSSIQIPQQGILVPSVGQQYQQYQQSVPQTIPVAQQYQQSVPQTIPAAQQYQQSAPQYQQTVQQIVPAAPQYQQTVQQIVPAAPQYQQTVQQIVPAAPQYQQTAQQVLPAISPCNPNPCLNEGECLLNGNSFSCKCPWGWTGARCEICLTECASNPCPENKRCKARFGGGFECVCPPERAGPNCELVNDLCANNPCLNGGVCRPIEGGSFTCECQQPWAGSRCEQRFENPCTEQVLRSAEVVQHPNPWDRKSYFICTDVNVHQRMQCATGTYFNENLHHCVPEGYDPPVCPRNHCLNDGECIMDESNVPRCDCRKGFRGERCEINIDECLLEGNTACAGGVCVDQVNGYYCRCPNGIGLNCRDVIQNPCTTENIEKDNVYFALPSPLSNTYLHCTSEQFFTVSRCADNLFWHTEERTCSTERAQLRSGLCASSPCKNGGECLETATGLTCECRTGFTGEHCEQMIDFCASNPCQNGGRCLSYAGGYTCICKDKVIDECCCHGITNPCPPKSKVLPGINNYFPHLFQHRYIHCDFDGRAFVKNCAPKTRWNQDTMSCLPEGFVVNQTDVEIRRLHPMGLPKNVVQQYGQAAPSYSQPAAPSYSQPAAPSYSQPSVQAYNQPAAQTYSQPAVQTYNQPAAQTYNQPAVQTYNQPAVQTYNQPAAQTYNQPAAQTYNQPAAQTYNQPAVQTYNQPAVQTYNQPAVQPTLEVPQQASYSQPTQEVPQQASYSQPTQEVPQQASYSVPEQPNYSEQTQQPSYAAPEQPAQVQQYQQAPAELAPQASYAAPEQPAQVQQYQQASYSAPSQQSYSAPEQTQVQIPQAQAYSQPTLQIPQAQTYSQQVPQQSNFGSFSSNRMLQPQPTQQTFQQGGSQEVQFSPQLLMQLRQANIKLPDSLMNKFMNM